MVCTGSTATAPISLELSLIHILPLHAPTKTSRRGLTRSRPTDGSPSRASQAPASPVGYSAICPTPPLPCQERSALAPQADTSASMRLLPKSPRSCLNACRRSTREQQALLSHSPHGCSIPVSYTHLKSSRSSVTLSPSLINSFNLATIICPLTSRAPCTSTPLALTSVSYTHLQKSASRLAFVQVGFQSRKFSCS